MTQSTSPADVSPPGEAGPSLKTRRHQAARRPHAERHQHRAGHRRHVHGAVHRPERRRQRADGLPRRVRDRAAARLHAHAVQQAPVLHRQLLHVRVPLDRRAVGLPGGLGVPAVLPGGDRAGRVVHGLHPAVGAEGGVQHHLRVVVVHGLPDPVRGLHRLARHRAVGEPDDRPRHHRGA